MLKKLRVKKRLLVCFLTVDLVILVMTTIGLTGLKYTLKNQNILTQYIIPINTEVLAARLYSNMIAAKLGEMMLAQDSSAYDSDVIVIDELLTELDTSLALLDTLYESDSADRQNINAYFSLIAEWNQITDATLEKLAQQDYAGAQQLLISSTSLRQEMIPIEQQITQAIETVRDSTIASSRALNIRYSYILLILLLCATLLSIWLTVRLTRSIVIPLRQVQDAANQMANGNLKIHVDYHSNDELGELAQGMRTMSDRVSYYMRAITNDMEQLAANDLHIAEQAPFLGDFQPAQNAIYTMVSSLNDTLTQINHSSDEVASSSTQVSNGSQALSQGATEQASSIEQLAATMNEISEKANTNAQYAEHARNAVETVSTQILSSNEQMQKMTQAMEEITTSSQQIGKIIKTIEDIAFQTNILALNAAVEAARAGVAGKGFAVVADEVRNLAGKSAEASQSTSALIANSLQSVENGSVIAQETAASLLTVVEGTKKVATQIEHIAAASEEQALAASQVTQGVIQISDVVQTNSATAEESAAASEELSGQAIILKNLVEQFKLL